MSKPASEVADRRPPTFSEAASLRQKACAAGFDPAYWYAVEWDRALKAERAMEVKFWNTTVVLFRTRDGQIHALEDRCAHRQTKLSRGYVEGCHIRCAYHGWRYAADGRLESIPHEMFGRSFPSVKLHAYPVRVRYGLIWVFFGDPSLMDSRPLPQIPEIVSHDAWACVGVDFTWRAHPTMIVNNIMDSTHVATLHSRRFRTRSFVYGPVTRCEAQGDQVLVSHTIKMDPTGLLRYIGGRVRVDTQDACYQYPYLWVGVGGAYKLWNFVLPLGANMSRVFILSCAARLKIPFTPWRAPRWLEGVLAPLGRHLLVNTLFREDGWSTELEQEGYELSFWAPAVDPHPAPLLCYKLTVRKWEEHLAREARRAPRPESAHSPSG